MKVKLSEIKTSSPRVRQTQDPEELDVLAASISALNQSIIPVGVRKNGDGYLLVYGHRRVAAAKQAGLKEIDAIEIEAPDDFLKVYGLVENVVRESMNAMDIAKALQQIKDESGWNDEKVGKFFGKNRQWVESYLAMLEPDVAKATKGMQVDLHFGPEHLKMVKAGLGTDRTQMPAVIKKVVKEGLSTRQARHVSDLAGRAFAQHGASAVKQLLSVPYEDLRDTTAALEPSELIRPQGHKPMQRNWKFMADAVDAALKALDANLSKLAGARDARIVIRKFVPKWMAALKRILKTLEAMEA